MLSYVKPLPELYDSDTTHQSIQPQTTSSDHLYHIILTTSHLSKDPNSQIEKLRVVGTFTSLSAAKAAAHRALFEAGYDSEMFKVYDTKQSPSGNGHHHRPVPGIMVHAEAEDGTTFEIRILTTPNTFKTLTTSDDRRVLDDLYHVVQTNVPYEDDECGSEREHNIEGSFLNYEDASQLAREVLLDASDGVSKESYAEYDEAVPGEKDCGYGENVLVHAVGTNGSNILISVVLGQVLESTRLAEAAMRIR